MKISPATIARWHRAVAICATALLLLVAGSAQAQYVTLTGSLSSASGLPAANATLTFSPSQVFFVGGTTVVVTEAQCGTDALGNVVGITNPQAPARVAIQLAGTLPAGNYYVEFAWIDGAGHVTQVSPETVKQLTGVGELQILPPVGAGPLGAVGMQVYIGTTPGSETLQGATGTPIAQYTQAVPLVAGAAPPTSNTTICKLVANDAGWPTGTGYNVSLVDASGNTLFSYPAMWQFFGVGSVYNLSNGLPYYHGQVTYPVPILSIPYNHNVQSISGPINLTGYDLLNVLEIGVGTALPAWGIDVEGSGLAGAINANTGYLFSGAAPLNHVLLGNGSYYVDSATIPWSIITGAPGSFYTTVAINTVALPQEPVLNFSSNFVGTDTSGVRSNIDLSSTGVSAGTYTVPTLTVNAQGRITAASNGTALTGIDQWVTFTSCVPASDGDNEICQGGPISWPSAFADTSYFIDSCMVDDSGTFTSSPAPTAFVQFHSKTTTGFSYTLTDVKGSSGPFPYTWPVTCHAHHP